MVSSISGGNFSARPAELAIPRAESCYWIVGQRFQCYWSSFGFRVTKVFDANLGFREESLESSFVRTKI